MFITLIYVLKFQQLNTLLDLANLKICLQPADH